MAVDYREVNMQFDYGKSVALSSDITSKIGWFYEKVDNLWWYRQFRLTKDNSKVTAIITPGVYRFLACTFGISMALKDFHARMAHEILQDYYWMVLSNMFMAQ